MNDIFRDLLDISVICYLDDILILSNSREDQIQHIKEVLKRLRFHKLYAKAEKCKFFQEEVEFLGFIVGKHGVSMDQAKVKTVMDWPTPQSLNDLQSFLGFANFYRKFIAQYSKICVPLTRLLKPSMPFQWNEEAEKAFQSLKQQFMAGSILHHFKPELPILLETDASDFAIGAILSQRGEDGVLKAIAFHSRKMSPPELNYPIYDKELLAIVDAFKAWRHYLEGSAFPINILTDHKNLEYFKTTRILSRRQARWSLLLNSYNYNLVYRPGKQSTKPDALTRRRDFLEGSKASNALPEQLLKPISISALEESDHPTSSMTSDIFSRLHAGTRTVVEIAPLLKYLKNPSLARPKEITSSLKPYSISEHGLVLHHGLIYVPQDDGLKADILKQNHDSPIAGHFGRFKTLELLKRNYYWPQMDDFVRNYLKTCDECQRAKPTRHQPYGKLQPLPVPSRPWSSISFDHITDLPNSLGYNTLFVVVCRLTKMAHFIPCLATDTAEDLAKIFVQNIFRLHGTPSDMVSDRGTTFTSKFFQEFVRLLETDSNLSTAFHPQTDGQTERINQILDQYLRQYCNYLQDNWANLMPLAEFAYNNSVSSTTSKTPFYATYGFHPRFSATSLDSTVPAAKDHVKYLQEVHEECKQKMAEAQERYKHYADQRRSNAPAFKLGDLVRLKRTNIKTGRPSRKMDHLFLGPFKILKVIGSSAFQLELPKSMHIHPVLHVSLSEPYHQNTLPNRLLTRHRDPTVLLSDEDNQHVSEIMDSKLLRKKLQ